MGSEKEKEKEKEIGVQELPDEILALIFSFLKWEHLLEVCKVSRKWRAIGSDDFIWRPLLSPNRDELRDVSSPLSWKRVQIFDASSRCLLEPPICKYQFLAIRWITRYLSCRCPSSCKCGKKRVPLSILRFEKNCGLNLKKVSEIKKAMEEGSAGMAGKLFSVVNSNHIKFELNDTTANSVVRWKLQPCHASIKPQIHENYFDGQHYYCLAMDLKEDWPTPESQSLLDRDYMEAFLGSTTLTVVNYKFRLGMMLTSHAVNLTIEKDQVSVRCVVPHQGSFLEILFGSRYTLEYQDTKISQKKLSIPYDSGLTPKQYLLKLCESPESFYSTFGDFSTSVRSSCPVIKYPFLCRLLRLYYPSHETILQKLSIWSSYLYKEKNIIFLLLKQVLTTQLCGSLLD